MKGLVGDSLVIYCGGQLPERPFEHWRTKRRHMDTFPRATGKQVTAVSERDSSFQLTAITSAGRPLSFRLTVCLAILVVGLIRQVPPAVYLVPIVIFLVFGFNPRSKGSWNHTYPGGFRWRATKSGFDALVIIAWLFVVLGLVFRFSSVVD